MHQLIEKKTNGQCGQCEFCNTKTGEHIVITTMEPEIGSTYSTTFCLKCYFGENPHIISYPIKLVKNEDKSIECKDCKEYGYYKLEFRIGKEVIYLCEKHFCR